MLKGKDISRRIKIETHSSVLGLDDILLSFESNQHKIKQEIKPDKKFEIGIVNKTRYWEIVTYVLNLGWIDCEVVLSDSWLQRPNGEHYFYEQQSTVKWNPKGARKLPQCLSSYDVGPLLQYGRAKTNPHVRLVVDRITEMCK